MRWFALAACIALVALDLTAQSSLIAAITVIIAAIVFIAAIKR